MSNWRFVLQRMHRIVSGPSPLVWRTYLNFFYSRYEQRYVYNHSCSLHSLLKDLAAVLLYLASNRITVHSLVSLVSFEQWNNSCVYASLPWSVFTVVFCADYCHDTCLIAVKSSWSVERSCYISAVGRDTSFHVSTNLQSGLLCCRDLWYIS